GGQEHWIWISAEGAVGAADVVEAEQSERDGTRTGRPEDDELAVGLPHERVEEVDGLRCEDHGAPAAERRIRRAGAVESREGRDASVEKQGTVERCASAPDLAVRLYEHRARLVVPSPEVEHHDACRAEAEVQRTAGLIADHELVRRCARRSGAPNHQDLAVA